MKIFLSIYYQLYGMEAFLFHIAEPLNKLTTPLWQETSLIYYIHVVIILLL